jgi:hypothetical protein
MDIDDQYKHHTAYLQLPKRQVESMDQVFDLTVTSTRLNLQNFHYMLMRALPHFRTQDYLRADLDGHPVPLVLYCFCFHCVKLL